MTRDFFPVEVLSCIPEPCSPSLYSFLCPPLVLAVERLSQPVSALLSGYSYWGGRSVGGWSPGTSADMGTVVDLHWCVDLTMYLS